MASMTMKLLRKMPPTGPKNVIYCNNSSTYSYDMIGRILRFNVTMFHQHGHTECNGQEAFKAIGMFLSSSYHISFIKYSPHMTTLLKRLSGQAAEKDNKRQTQQRKRKRCKISLKVR